MEKTFFIATLFFSWFITISLAVFSYFAIQLGYTFIGICLIVIMIASIAMNTVFRKKWKRTF
ncbi:hypothetical protein [Bacillus sp. FJAT-50079]|uniref:hypothetical protein n=1 Tax=Bacillus sp. FJAT-50079 TaxID=2833577 RepID=UPI001BCA4135|nr:hypothetical protein [Bacillus sp. FJAT-50079]MBS4207424.1 hypothetical protein [Bacillus sp. FJAT-50079]